MLLNKFLKSEVTLASPHACVKYVILLLELLLPFALPRILDFKSQPSGLSIFPFLERFDGRRIGGSPRGFLQKVIHICVIILVLIICVGGLRYEITFH